ncbi:MAG TPA: sensor histidine kinase [Nocardioides sp.]|uniref:sensor histidine kinase n=1 Tax=Nocardioides sp. TaxID=35761 RepID=UPI002F4218A3
MTGIRDWLRAHWWVLLLLVVTLAGTLGRWHDRPKTGAGILAGIAVLVLLGRRWRPELTWLANAAAVTSYFALGYGDGPIYLSILASAYALTSRWPPRRWWPYALAAAPIAAAIASRWADQPPGSVAARIVWFVAVLSASAAIGAAMRTRTETRREHARRTATEERLRMAQDLHDGVGHGLAVIAMQAGVALHVLDRDPVKARESLLAIRETSRESLDALRAELSRLSAEPGGGPRTVRNGLADLAGLVARVRAGGLDVDLHSTSEPVRDEIGAAAYLVVQEALTNVLRHSGATSARVDVSEEPGAVVVTVVDDGQGGAVSEGLGIGSMRARVERLGGTLSVGPTSGGFEVRAVIPSVVP